MAAISINEASKRAGIGRSIIHRDAKRGLIKGTKVDRVWELDEASFDAWAAQRGPPQGTHRFQKGHKIRNLHSQRGLPQPRRALTKADLPAITQLAARGVRETDIARALGIGAQTWQRLRREDDAVIAAYDDGKQQLHDSLIGKLYERAMNGDTACLIFSCKVLLGYRENEPAAEFRPQINITLPAALPMEKFETLSAEYQKLPAPLKLNG